MQKILVIEDEPKVAAFLKKGLEEDNYSIDIAPDGLVGKSNALLNRYDLIILDINIPQINGFQLCKIIRDNNNQTPILMLTALSSIDEKVRGFNMGADDYLLKPFEFQELLVRIKSLLKRSSSIHSVSPTILKIADLEIDRRLRIVKRTGKKIELSAKEFALLEYLAIHNKRVVSRQELIEKIWGLKFDTGTNVVDVFINFIRKKIDSGFEPKLIHTRVGMGYFLDDITVES